MTVQQCERQENANRSQYWPRPTKEKHTKKWQKMVDVGYPRKLECHSWLSPVMFDSNVFFSDSVQHFFVSSSVLGFGWEFDHRSFVCGRPFFSAFHSWFLAFVDIASIDWQYTLFKQYIATSFKHNSNLFSIYMEKLNASNDNICVLCVVQSCLPILHIVPICSL